MSHPAYLPNEDRRSFEPALGTRESVIVRCERLRRQAIQINEAVNCVAAVAFKQRSAMEIEFCIGMMESDLAYLRSVLATLDKAKEA